MRRRPPFRRKAAGQDETRPRGEIYVEFVPVGQAMKVTAIDAESGLEVTIMGPASASQNDLKRVAVRKLRAQLAKGADASSSDDSDDNGEPDGGDGGPKGWIA